MVCVGLQKRYMCIQLLGYQSHVYFEHIILLVVLLEIITSYGVFHYHGSSYNQHLIAKV